MLAPTSPRRYQPPPTSIGGGGGGGGGGSSRSAAAARQGVPTLAASVRLRTKAFSLERAMEIPSLDS